MPTYEDGLTATQDTRLEAGGEAARRRAPGRRARVARDAENRASALGSIVRVSRHVVRTGVRSCVTMRTHVAGDIGVELGAGAELELLDRLLE